MSIMQLVKKKKGKKRPGYRGPGGYQGGRSDPGGSSKSSGNTGGGFTGGGGGGRDASTTSFDSSANPNRPGGPIGRDDSGAPGPDRSAVSQFSQFGKNVFAQNLDPRLRFDPRTGGMRKPLLSGLGSTIFGGLLSLINPALGLAFRGINFMRDKIPETFQNFKSSNTLEEFRDKMRGYGRTMPVTSNNPAFGGIESLGVFDDDDEEENIITPMAKPNIFNYNNSVGRFDPNQTINTEIGMGASRNMVNPEDMNQQFMNGGIVDLVDIYD